MGLLELFIMLCMFAFISVLLKVFVDWIGGFVMFFIIMFIGCYALLELISPGV